MYTVAIEQKVKNENTRQIELTVVISNSVSGNSFKKLLTFPLYTTVEQINRVIKEYIIELEAGDTLESAVTVGPIDLAAVGTDVPPEKAAFIQFIQDVSKRERVQKLIEWGIVPANNAKVVALNGKIQAALQANPTFLDQL